MKIDERKDIDDHEAHNLPKLCNEVFGEKLFSVYCLAKKYAVTNETKGFSTIHDSIVGCCLFRQDGHDTWYHFGLLPMVL